jgi:alanyl-tRNA synthetase
MGERLYYQDQRRTAFSATVVERLTWSGQPAVVLDRTAFYPTSGGQPSDLGGLGGVPVLDVVVREDDGAVVHVLEREIESGTVNGEVDWERRFDHMQQHTGQHVLSAAFERLLDADTVGSHLGSVVSTIDLDVSRLDRAAVEPVEELANQVIWENRPVLVRTVGPEDLALLALRRPPTVEGPVRIVEIRGSESGSGPSFDVNPCGGTHVERTGEIGLVKVVRIDYRGNQTRVEFVCGGRALQDYGAKNQMVGKLAGTLTVGYWELDRAVDRLREEVKALRRELSTARDRLVRAEAAELARTCSDRGPYCLVAYVWEKRTPAELRSLALALAEYPRMVALLAAVGERTHLCFARADELDLDVAALIRQSCASLEGKGGGRPHLAQGSARVVDPVRVEAALSQASSNLVDDRSS